MAKSPNTEKRWTFDRTLLQWTRKSNGKIEYRPKSDFSGRESDTSLINIFRQWKWLLTNKPSTHPDRSKNGIIKRIPALYLFDAKEDGVQKTRRHVDGKVRAMWTYVIEHSEGLDTKALERLKSDHNPKWKDPSKVKSRAAKKKAERAIEGITKLEIMA